MKNILSIVFVLGMLASFAVPDPTTAGLGFAASFAGYAFTRSSYSSELAFLQIVPGKFKVARDSNSWEEVPYMSRAEKALYDNLITLGRSNAVTQQAINQGAISFDPISYYIRYNITGLSGNQKFLSQATIRSVGTTNFPNGAVLPQYYNFCFDRITVRTVATNTANTAIGSTSGYTSVAASVDPAVRNGELIIRSNRNIIVETPVIDFLSAAAVTGGGVRDNDGGILEKPRFFLELLNIEAELSLAGTVSNTANTTTILEVVFSGVQARLKF